MSNFESNFQTIGSTIYDPNGQEFIIKGTNMFAWEGTSNVDSYLNDWGFNTVRVPNYLLGSYNQPAPADDNYATNHNIVNAFTSQGAVVIFDAHDRIGSYYEGEDFETLKAYWRDMAREFADNPYVWFNLSNEPGNANANPDKWVAYHRELIEIIRAEGATNTIVIDGEAWGQDYPTQTILNAAGEILTDNDNIVFSIHVYDRWNNNDIAQYFDLLEAQDIPVIVGEYGSENVNISTLNATTQMLNAAAEREIGRIVWVAKALDNNDLTFGPFGDAQHFDGTNPEILTDLGLLVWQDLQRTEDLSILASGSGYIFEIDSNSPPNTTIVNFGGIGRGINPTSEVVAELDTLKFIGENFTASNLLLTQADDDLIITFEGDPTTQVTLENFQLENLDNIPKTKRNQTELGNILFNNQNLIEDSFDVFNANSKQKRIWNKNSVTFLNNLNNQVQGFNKSNDTINGQAGDDTISGLGGNDLLRGEIGDDLLLGGKGSDTLRGGIGNDLLLGGKGNDILVGQEGNDTLTGGKGEDLFLLNINNTNNTFDVITDFQDGVDLIELSSSLKFEDLIITQGVGENIDDTLVNLLENDRTIAIVNNTNYQSLTEIDFAGLS